MTEHPSLYIEREPPLAWIVFNRPDKHNAFTKRMWRDLPFLIEQLDTDPEVRVILFRGAGHVSFCAGADITEMVELYEEFGSDSGSLASTGVSIDAISDCNTPTVSMINGLCFGGGCAIALCTDIRLASDDAQFAITPAKIGLGYPFKGIERAVQELGPANARYLLMTALRLDATQAQSIGLIQGIHPKNEIGREARALGMTIAGNAPKTIRAIRKSVKQAVLPPSDRATRAIQQWILDCAKSDDYREGLEAFIEKRKPKFRGR